MKRIFSILIIASFLFAGCDKKVVNSQSTNTSIPVAYSLYAITTYNGNLVVGGPSGSGKFSSGIAQLNGTTWTSLGSGIQGNGEIISFANYNGKLIAAGSFNNIGGVTANNIAQWNGTSWSPLGSGVIWNGNTGTVFALAIYQGNLIATGDFDTAGGISVNNIAQWNGSSWSAMGNGLGAGGEGTTLMNYNGNLVVTGQFTTAGTLTAYDIAEWNGSVWDTLPLTYFGLLGSGPAGGGTVCNGNLVVGGYGNIEQWNGTKWVTLGTDFMEGPGFPICGNLATTYNGNPVICDGDVMQWNGNAWNSLSSLSGISSTNNTFPRAFGMTIYNGNLVICGIYLGPDNVAVYNGSTWIGL